MRGTSICHYGKFILAQTGSVATQVAMVDGVVFCGMITGSSQVVESKSLKRDIPHILLCFMA